MTNKPILTEDQLDAKIAEFNDIPMENKHAGMRASLDCEHVRELLNHAWDYAKKTATEAGETDLDKLYCAFLISTIETILEGIDAPPVVIAVLGKELSKNSIMNGMLWHVFSEVVPEEDVVLLTGGFDVHSEVSNG